MGEKDWALSLVILNTAYSQEHVYKIAALENVIVVSLLVIKNLQNFSVRHSVKLLLNGAC